MTEQTYGMLGWKGGPASFERLFRKSRDDFPGAGVTFTDLPEGALWSISGTKTGGTIMTVEAGQVLKAFDALPATEQQAVAVEILRRTSPAGALPDQSLDELADELFRSYDAKEGADANSGQVSAIRSSCTPRPAIIT